jgi:hypothetical protein
MNTRILAAALMLAATGATFAQEAQYEPFKPSASIVSRAQVQAEVLQARAAGQLRVNEADFARFDVTPGGKTREAVIAEVRAALASGEIDALNSQAYDFLASGARKAITAPVAVVVTR